MDDRRTTRGSAAELYAAKRLERSGFALLDHNWRTRWGELDIVAIENDILVFVEVRVRSGERLGRAEETVDQRKLQRLVDTGSAYIEAHPEHANRYWRVDLVAITLDGSGAVTRYTHIENLVLD